MNDPHALSVVTTMEPNMTPALLFIHKSCDLSVTIVGLSVRVKPRVNTILN